MGWTRRKPLPRSGVCSRCLKKYAQAQGLCRTCGRDVGIYSMTTLEADRARLERLRPTLLVEQSPRHLPTRIVDGVEYQVVFDGS